MDKAKSSFHIEHEDVDGGGGGGGAEGAKILCVCSGAFKNRPGQGEGVKIGYRTKGLITWAGLARFAEILAP